MRKLILLLQPWIEDFYFTDCRIQPIGLAYLAASIQQNFSNVDVLIYDALAGGEKRTLPWPKEFKYLEKYYGCAEKGPFKLFSHYYRFGKSEEQISRDLCEFSPFLIGISSLFTPYYRQSLALSQICRKLYSNVPIVMGGSHATMHPQTLFVNDGNHSLCDFVIRGEGELRICKLIERLLSNRSTDDLDGVIANDLAINPGIEKQAQRASEQPIQDSAQRMLDHSTVTRDRPSTIPVFNGLNMADYTYSGRRMSFLITSRSCPHRCSFCSIHAVFGYEYRIRKIDDILDEIRLRYDQGIRHFDIEDDNFTVNKNEIGKLLDGIISMNLPITFTAMNGLSYISLNQTLLEKMRDAGFSTLNLALVSSDKLVLQFANRPHTLDKFRNIVDIANALGLRSVAYFILGMPGQKLDDMWNTFTILAQKQCLVGASPFYFTPGSPIHIQERDNSSLRLMSSFYGDPYFSARLTAMDLESDDFTRDDIFTLFKLTRLANYVKSGLDRNLQLNDAFFNPAITVLKTKRWLSDIKHDNDVLPFSTRVAAKLESDDIIFTGYRSPNTCIWNSQRHQFQSIANRS